jgi:hypothetical protein
MPAQPVVIREITASEDLEAPLNIGQWLVTLTYLVGRREL